MTGVTGWCSASPRTGPGMVSTGTKPLPRKGSSMRIIGVFDADSTVRAAAPIATDSQVSITPNSAKKPVSASHPAVPAPGRKPSETATPSTAAAASSVCSTAPTTCPPSTATEATGMVRRRVTIPPVMSIATLIAVDCAMLAAVITSTAGVM